METRLKYSSFIITIFLLQVCSYSYSKSHGYKGTTYSGADNYVLLTFISYFVTFNRMNHLFHSEKLEGVTLFNDETFKILC